MKPLLQVEQLCFQHCGPVNLTVTAGQIIAISGDSGSGKSLMLRSIADMDDHRGDVLLDTVNANSLLAPEWRRQVALLPAESQWWFDSIGEHFSRFDKDLLADFSFTEDVMNWSVSRMSSGEKQRLALLRLLNNQPRVLLLDEPTANLDKNNVQIFEKMVSDYIAKHDACALWVSHDIEQLHRVTSLHYKLEQGQLNLQEEVCSSP